MALGNALRATPQLAAQRYFKRNGRSYELSPELGSHVRQPVDIEGYGAVVPGSARHPFGHLNAEPRILPPRRPPCWRRCADAPPRRGPRALASSWNAPTTTLTTEWTFAERALQAGLEAANRVLGQDVVAFKQRVGQALLGVFPVTDPLAIDWVKP